MKKIFYLLSLLFIISYGVQAQSKQDRFGMAGPNRPYFVINGKHVDPLSLMVIDHCQVKQVKTLPPAEAQKKYGKAAAKNGAVEITLNKDVKTVGLQQLFTLYHIQKKAKKLPVQLYFGVGSEKLYINEPQLFVASEKRIAGLGVDLYGSQHKPVLFVQKFLQYPVSIAEPGIEKKLDSLENIFAEEIKVNLPPDTVVIVGQLLPSKL